jgi:rSAM/selenodomain-associated transferase 1
MAKYPAPGRVKTRLAAVLGDGPAAALYRAFILDLAARLAALPYETTWVYAPAEAPFPALVPGFRCRPQRNGDLGERMAAAVAEEMAARPGPALVIGADAPHLPAARLAEAAAALAGAADVALGPALDGGYYLIGLAAPAPSLFVGLAWGTSSVLAETLERAHGLGLRTHLLPPGFDVDQAADLVRLREVLAAGDIALDHTRWVLDLLDTRGT